MFVRRCERVVIERGRVTGDVGCPGVCFFIVEKPCVGVGSFNRLGGGIGGGGGG